MAASRAPQYPRGVMSEPRVNALPRQNFLSAIDDRFLFNQIAGEKEDSKPNNYYNWKPSSTFAEPASGAVRSKKSKNREREQNFTGQQDREGVSFSNGPSRRRTPATYPRTQHVSSAIDREELENLRFQMTFSDMDDQSTDSHALGSVSRANGVSNLRPETVNDDASRRPMSALDTIFVNEMPDRNKIVARLMQIRDYLKQANGMMVTLQNATESAEKADQVSKLGRLQDHLQEQERGYLALLERMLAEELGTGTTPSLSGVDTSSVATSNDLNLYEPDVWSRTAVAQAAAAVAAKAAVNIRSGQQNLNDAEPEGWGAATSAAAAATAAATAEAMVNGRSSQNSGESFATSVAESASINLDARSDISEATTEGTFTARTRPQIESHLGNHSRATSDVSDISDSELDDIRSVSSQATGSFGLDTQELHEQYSSMLQKYQDGSPGNTDAAVIDSTEDTADDAGGTLRPEDFLRGMNPTRQHRSYRRKSQSSQTSSISTLDPTEGQKGTRVSEQIEALEGLRKQHDLLKQMLKQQEELRTLQDRQVSLMALQSQLESRMRNSELDRPDETLSVSTVATTTTATSVNTEDIPPVTTTAGASNRYQTGVPLTAADLQERRRTLLRMLAEQEQEQEEPEQSQSAGIQQPTRADWMDQRAEVAPPLISSEHQELREKLEALQEKKRQMDSLLAQLHALHPNMQNLGGDTSSIASTTSNANEDLIALMLGQGNETSDDSEAVLTNGPDSLRKLHEVRERLGELRDLVQQYQDTSHLLDSQVEDARRQQHQQQQQLSLAANFEDPDLLSNLRRLERGEQLGRLANQLAYGDGAHVQVGSGQTTSTVTETETETETESNHSSILAAWGDDPEIQEKVRKLKEAKQKLRQLQSLVAMVQQTPEVATALPDDLAELAADLTADYSNRDDDDEEEESDEENEEEEDEDDEETEETDSELVMGGRGDQREQATSSLSEGEIPPEVARETKEAYYEAKMQQQRRELQGLMAERQRLLGVQQQLRELNDNLPPVNKDAATSRVKSVNISTAKRNHAATRMNAVATPSRDEVYSEMRRNKMLQEELRQKKSELSDLLRIVKQKRERLRDGSDDQNSFPTELAEYDNDLFRELLMDAGRMSMRSADITAAATWGGSTQVSEDEGLEDGYPSDGILQVEEEEEEQKSTVTSETYTIESGTKPYRRPQTYPGVRRVIMEDDGDTSSMDAARHGIRYPRKLNSAPGHQVHQRQENIQPAEDLVSVSDTYEAQAGAIKSLQGHINQLQRQLSNSMGLCQSLITDQQSMSNLLTGSLNAGYGPSHAAAPTTNPFSTTTPQPQSGLPSGRGSGEGPVDDLVHNYNMRLQHQQLMLNLNSAYNQLYSQQEQIQRLRGQLEEHVASVTSASEASFDVGSITNTNANNNAPHHRAPWNSVPGYPRPAPGQYERSQEFNPYRGAMYNPGLPFHMTPTFPAGFSQPSPGDYTTPTPSRYQSNPYVTNDLGRNVPGQPDEYVLYARQAPPPVNPYRSASSAALNPYKRAATAAANITGSYSVPPNTAQVSNDDDEFEAAYLNGASGIGAKRSVPMRTMSGMRTLDSGIGDMNDHLARDTIDMKEEAAVSVPPLNISSLLRKSEQQRRLREDTGSQRSNASSSKGGKRPTSSTTKGRAQRSDQSRPSDRLAKLVGPSMGQGLSSSISGTAFLDTASVASTMSMSSLPGELSDRGNGGKGAKAKGGRQKSQQQQQQQQQDTDRSIRSQTSELESDAGSEFSLFEALRESIYSEVASLISQNEARPHFLIELFRELQMLNSDYLRQRALYALQDLVSKYLTDDNNSAVASASEAPTLPSERPMPAWMFFAGSEQTPSESFITSDEDEIKARLFGMNQLKPHESSYMVVDDQYDYIENVDSASSLSTPRSTSQGEFGFANEDLGDTVIHLDKALKRMREFERMKAEAEASGTSSVDNLKDRAMSVSASDMTSNSSAQDMGSESSFSDLPYPRIDTRQLDLQIKGIMQEVIPYLKEHMDDVCSPQLLAYIRRLVLGLARQRDESREFVRFFNRQLGSILEDSLAKFSGRKMRECGEDLLVDISEILFNELAFFRLMQDLDTAGNKLKQEAAKRDGEDDEDDNDDEDDEEEGEDQTETGTETGTAQEQGEDESSSEESSSSSSSDEDEDDVGNQKGDQGGNQMEDALESAMAVASQFEEEQLGNARDDVMAEQVDISDREEDSEPQGVDHLQIELSMSESKGVTYIGSGEEEDDPDNYGEAVEETITSIGAANADGEVDSVVDSVDDNTTSTAILVENETDASLKEESISRQESLEKDPSPPAPAEMAPGPDGASESTPATSDTKEEEEEEAAGATIGENNNEEITMEDLPPKLTVLSQTALDSQMTKEQAGMDGIQGVLETMADGEAQLAGDPLALRAPEGAPVENGLDPVGDVGSEE